MSDTPWQTPTEDGMRISATGNDFKPGTEHDQFITLTGGDGNLVAEEVHVQFNGCCGDFAQGWFRIEDLEAAIAAAREATSRIVSDKGV